MQGKEGNRHTAAIGIVLVMVEPKSAGLSSLGSTYGMTGANLISRALIAMGFTSLPRSARRISFFEAMFVGKAVDLVGTDTRLNKSRRLRN